MTPKIHNGKTVEITTDVEFETGRIINGKKEFGKQFNFGNLGNATNVSRNVMSPEEKITYAYGIAINSDAYTRLPIPNQNIKLFIEYGWINITTFEDLSNYTATLYLFYTKN